MDLRLVLISKSFVWLDISSYEEGDPMFKEAVQGRQRVTGKDARSYDYVRYWAWCLHNFGHYGPAYMLGKEASSGLVDRLGSEHPSTLM